MVRVRAKTAAPEDRGRDVPEDREVSVDPAVGAVVSAAWEASAA
jgi:hypothetical protein